MGINFLPCAISMLKKLHQKTFAVVAKCLRRMQLMLAEIVQASLESGRGWI